jgi:hypothetical protein
MFAKSSISIFLTAVLLGFTPLVRAQDADLGPKLEEAQQKALTQLSQRGVLVQPLSAGSNWYYVNFRGAERPDSSLFALLKGVVGIVELDLAGQKLADSDFSVLATLKNLRKLSLARSNVQDASLVHLKDLQKLESLNLFSTEITDAGLDSLKVLRGMKRLYVFQTKTTDAGVAKLKAAFGLTIEQGAVLTIPPAPEPKKDEPKKDEPKKDEPKKDEPKK